MKNEFFGQAAHESQVAMSRFLGRKVRLVANGQSFGGKVESVGPRFLVLGGAAGVVKVVNVEVQGVVVVPR